MKTMLMGACVGAVAMLVTGGVAQAERTAGARPDAGRMTLRCTKVRDGTLDSALAPGGEWLHPIKFSLNFTQCAARVVYSPTG